MVLLQEVLLVCLVLVARLLEWGVPGDRDLPVWGLAVRVAEARRRRLQDP